MQSPAAKATTDCKRDGPIIEVVSDNDDDNDNDNNNTEKLLQKRRMTERTVSLPEIVDNMFTWLTLMLRWKEQHIHDGTEERVKHATMATEAAPLVAEKLLPYMLRLNKSSIHTPHHQVLEVGCRDGVASCILRNSLDSAVCAWIAVDTTEDWQPRQNMDDNDNNIQPFADIVFGTMNAQEAVVAYGRGSSILLLMFPPKRAYLRSTKLLTTPNYCGYEDYYAIRTFIEQPVAIVNNVRQHRLIVIVGELGIAHGSKGLYTYLMKHPNLKLLSQEPIPSSTTTTSVKNDMFIFRLL